MSSYSIPLETTVVVYVEVEAETIAEAMDLAGAQGTPGLMCLDHTYPDTGDWEVPEWFIKEAEENDFPDAVH